MIRNYRQRTGLALSALIVAGLVIISDRASAQANRCTEEAASIRRAESQLPRLEIAPPDDQQIVCITLETNILFARRMAAHLMQCPRSPHARSADAWQRTGSQYTAQFGNRGCKPAIRGYRG
ncbi:MAG: hypothetical protein QOF91_909 [Alphaproteobacteria bacterium]|jgi:hypothetical protein|nr:hypothetical protein [Alphaproteobacteria bacterium]MEA3025624.1 hypothetical protein [Alphaproteobacteria bacterium]